MQMRKYRKIPAIIMIFAIMVTIVSMMGACKQTGNVDNNVPDGSQVQSPAPTDTLTVPEPSATPNVTLPDEDSTDLTITKPTLIVEGAKAKAGSKGVEVVIKVAKNPGILGMDFDLYYDDSVMVLANAQSELALEGCFYTPPAYFRNPTSFLWDFQDANWVEDGAILTLYFDILDTAPLGEYEIKIMYSYGNIFDTNCEPIDVGVKNACISIEA